VRKSLRIMSVVGARPNFMKIAPFAHAIERHNTTISESSVFPPISHSLVHTGQHYDEAMSKSFFEALGIPAPDIDLGIGSGTHAEQVGQTMIEFEKVVRDWRPDWVVVVGDVNATCACSITAKKEHARLAHIEAGLRSFDLEMPEEINRMVTDRLSDLLLTTDELADRNLEREGVSAERIRRVGNIMIDTLEAHRSRAAAMDLTRILKTNALSAHSAWVPDEFVLMTLHRPSNVDDTRILTELVGFVVEVASEKPVVWPVHPRTEKSIREFGLWEMLGRESGVILLNPVGYLEMLKLNMEASIMFTDSGGLQEECCVLGTPCLTLRWNTERPKTLCEHGGVSVLVGNDVERIRTAYDSAKKQDKKPHRPALWDGRTSDRIVEALLQQV